MVAVAVAVAVWWQGVVAGHCGGGCSGSIGDEDDNNNYNNCIWGHGTQQHINFYGHLKCTDFILLG